MKRYLQKTLLIFLISIGTFACKKDQDAKNPIENAKKWYLNTKSTLSLYANDNAIGTVKPEVSWEKAQIYTLDDGSEVVGTPINLKSADVVGPKGSYMLFISKKENTYKSVISYNEEKDYFLGKTFKTKIQTTYERAKALNDISKKESPLPASSARGKVMQGKEMISYIDWYWVTTYYNDEGNVIDVNWAYVTTTCPGGGGVGSGGGEENDEQQDSVSTEEADPDLNSDCSSWKYVPVGPEQNYQACGVSGIDLDYVTSYQNRQGEIQVDYIYYKFNVPIYFEFPHIRANGVIIDAASAAVISAKLRDEAEEEMENELGSKPNPGGTVIENIYLRKLAQLMARYGGRVSRISNYGTVPVNPLKKGFRGGSCN